jgi:hypothetical protein
MTADLIEKAHARFQHDNARFGHNEIVRSTITPRGGPDRLARGAGVCRPRRPRGLVGHLPRVPERGAARGQLERRGVRAGGELAGHRV